MKNYKGITLIALVVTIVVLLILAAVSISMLTGENGIIEQAQKSKDATEQAKVEEIVDLAINTLISENNGSTNGITPKAIADKINTEYSQYENVYADDENNFPTKIIFPEEGNREVEVDLDNSKIYSTNVSEEDIAPVDIFKYEIISDAETGATNLDSLPTKEARITGIKEKYCNGIYSSQTEEQYENTNYEIVLEDGTKITDTLIIPYQVEIDGEMYKITEANIRAFGTIIGGGDGYSFPAVKTIIYPNTIKKISGAFGSSSDTLEKVILSNNLEEIGEYTFFRCVNLVDIEIPNSVAIIGNEAFSQCKGLNNIEIPNTVISIGNYAFNNCNKLTSIEIPNSVKSIGDFAFENCRGLTSIEIPSSVTSIGSSAFENCTSLNNIEIPNSVTSIGSSAFKNCTSLNNIEIPSSVTSIENSTFSGCSSLTSIEIPSTVTSIGNYAFSGCSSLTTVNYIGTMEQWKQINISSYNNNNLTDAQIICTDGTIN